MLKNCSLKFQFQFYSMKTKDKHLKERASDFFFEEKDSSFVFFAPKLFKWRGLRGMRAIVSKTKIT